MQILAAVRSGLCKQSETKSHDQLGGQSVTGGEQMMKQVLCETGLMAWLFVWRSISFARVQPRPIPDTVKHLNNIRSLDLSSNKLEILKPWIGRFKLLKILNVEHNKLHYFPAELCLLTKLETLNASNNLLTSLIMPGHVTNFAEMQNLRFIHLSSNCLTEFPVELCSASIPIHLLDLSNNQIGLIPSCVSSIQAMELNMDHNQLTTIAPSIAKCPRLKVLRLEHNRLTVQAFPTELLTNSQVSSMSVSGNLFEMRDFYSLPGYSQVKSNQNWYEGFKALIGSLALDHRLPAWGPRDHGNRWLEIPSDMAKCRK
ncbi:unnamed protein product [Echinostoma caproni]|uniref:LRRCT domain-containing protein n=1 Tax=Echinostoma caproni TaxID=27848 RepID=A0A183B1W1_9TREM|nr:unnamed protein product [Echinostoma caproni]